MNEEIKKAIQEDNLILFVGAGMSMPFGFPNWTSLILDILKELKKGGKSPVDFQYYIDQGKSLNVFKVLKDLETHGFKKKVKEKLYEKIKSVNIENEDYKKIEKLWKISEKIITTNYDKVLEKQKPSHIDSFINSNSFQQVKSLKENPFLYKIHGDYLDPDSCILFKSDYKELYKKDTSDLQTLKTIISTKTILFLGFSFEDKYIKEQFKYLRALYKGYGREHFIVQTNNKDLTEYGLKTIKIENWNESFDAFLDKLLDLKKKPELKSEIIENVEVDISTIDNIDHLAKLLEEKNKEFEQTSNKEEKEKASKKMHRIKHRMQELFLKKIDFGNKVVEHKQGNLKFIFEEIFTSEKLTKSIKSEIQQIRGLHSNDYQWYHRSVIVSALACSLINHKKVDPAKIDLLIDFIIDTEEKVWQKGITYLFITLNHLGNKWIRYANKLKPKLESLKSQPEIQKALNSIITLLQMKFHDRYLDMGQIFENEYFTKSSFNYFLPFYEDNPSIEKVYDNDEIEDVEDYIQFLYMIPLPDSLKYLICNENSKSNKEDKKEINEKERNIIRKIIGVHYAFNPYLNYVNEFFSFYKFFPDIEKSLKENTSIVVFNKLKDYLLNKVEYHRAAARSFMLEDEHSKAITHFKNLLVIDENDLDAMSNLAYCYRNGNNSDEELKVRLKISEKDEKNHYNKFSIGIILGSKKEYKKTIEFFNQAIEISEEKEYFENRGISYFNLKKYKKSEEDLLRSIELGNKKLNIYITLGNIKSILGDFDNAIEYYNKAYDKSKTNEEKSKTLIEIAYTYKTKEEYNEALRCLNEALKLDKNNARRVNIEKGFIKEDLEDFDEALKYYDLAFKESKTNEEKSRTLCFRGDVYLEKEMYEEALEDFNKSTVLDNKNFGAYAFIANLNLKVNKLNEAIESCKLALNKVDGLIDRSNILRIKAGVYRQQEKYKKALKLLDKISKELKNVATINEKQELGKVYGTMASIHSDIGDDDKFYEFLEKSFELKTKAKWLFNDIKEKYKNEARFKELLKKYNQKL
jgi:tetratricopeptide (TPR) repeat protein